jgi:phosphatidylserine/phosphatidylglycerophosphate/cardiolipin synthase-like enzyme
MNNEEDKKVLEGLRKLVRQVEVDLYRPKPRYLDAFFFPNKSNVYKLESYIKRAQKSLLICVFNLTNDVLANAVIDRHKNGVQVRVISDDECCKNKGNDIQTLADAGIPVRTDDAPDFHMHNKFMVVDNAFLLTGSFNWTFQAGANNQENLLVVDHPYYLEKYTAEFENLWN